MDNSDRTLLNLIQSEFPLTPEPYSDLGKRLGTSGSEIIRRIANLKKSGIIRMLGPVIDARSLGFHSTLVAMKVDKAHLENAEQVIAAHPGVSHGYVRDHRFNIWFTLSVPRASNVDSELERIIGSTGAKVAFSLPAVKMFKIGAYFDMSDGDDKTRSVQHRHPHNGQIELTETDRLIIIELQQDLPLVQSPFDSMAEKTGMDIEQFLAGCRSLLQRGVIRRFSASINHNHAGFTANAMTCWAVPPDKVDAFGNKLASLKEVSHCYERKTNPHWQHNLFAMIHGRSREVCQEIADIVSAATGLKDYVQLYSTREFKKTRVKYLV